MLLVLRGAGQGVGVSCSRRQLQAAIVLLLLATCCCAQHGKAASGSWRANSEQRAAAATRALAQQPAIGDDDEFEWSTSQKQAAAGAGKAITKPADAGQPGSEAKQQAKALQGSSPQRPAPDADAAAAGERSKLEADTAAAAVAAAPRNADSKVKEPVEAGAPAVLGDHTVAAEQQKGPSKQRAADASKQAPQQQEAPQGQQDTTAGTWAPVQQPAAKAKAVRDDVGPEGALCYSLVGYRGSRQHSLPCSSNNRPGRTGLSTVTEPAVQHWIDVVCASLLMTDHRCLQALGGGVL